MAKEAKKETPFIKVASVARIAEVKSKISSFDLKFDGLDFTPEQASKLINIQKANEDVRVTIEVVQGRFGDGL